MSNNHIRIHKYLSKKNNMPYYTCGINGQVYFIVGFSKIRDKVTWDDKLGCYTLPLSEFKYEPSSDGKAIKLI